MSDRTVDDIRRDHEEVNQWGQPVKYLCSHCCATSPHCCDRAARLNYEDRAILLAEIDRLRVSAKLDGERVRAQREKFRRRSERAEARVRRLEAECPWIA